MTVRPSTTVSTDARTDRIRWGIVSTGHIAGVFADNVAILPDHAVTAVSSRDVGRVAAFAEEHAPGASAYGSVDELAAADDVDIVYVATPHNRHHHEASRVLEAGKHVLIEKPMTVNAAQTADLRARSAAAGRLCMEAMWMRTNPLHQQLLSEIRDGVIGTVHAVSARLGFPEVPDPATRLRDPGQAGGALLDMGVYPVTFAYAVLGEPTSIAATSVRAATGVDGTTGIVLGYPDAVATVVTSIEADMLPTGLVMGSEGLIEAEAYHACTRYTVRRHGEEPVVRTISWPGTGYTYEAEEAAAGVRSGWTESRLIPLGDTLAVMRILDECRRQIGLSYGELEEFEPLGGSRANGDPTPAAAGRSVLA
jgi:predicted dehydrogenase